MYGVRVGVALRGIGLALSVLGFGGCVENAALESMIPFDYAPVAAPRQQPASEGAIWPGTSQAGSFLFFDEKARRPGDLLTVVISENISASGEANTDLDSKSDISANLSSDVGFQEYVADAARIVFEALGVASPGQSVASGTTLNVLEAAMGSKFEGEGSTSRKAGFNGVVTARVLNVLPGDVLHIRGRRMLQLNHELQVVTIEGLVRQEDVSINNTVRSTEMAEARLTFDGVGVIDDRQRPGLISRVLSWVYPF